MFYVVGEGGERKSRLLQYAQDQLREDSRIVFAHRYTTRCLDTGRHDEIRLTLAEFSARKRHALFAMSWEARGVAYAVGTEINYWLAVGLSVVIRGSRAYLPEALTAYPDMTVIWITADSPHAVGGRAHDFLCQSVPEHHASRIRRLACGPRVVHIGSSGALPVAGEELVFLLGRNAG
jgi:ribose 1,5-bisphosphokinase